MEVCEDSPVEDRQLRKDERVFSMVMRKKATNCDSARTRHTHCSGFLVDVDVMRHGNFYFLTPNHSTIQSVQANLIARVSQYRAAREYDDMIQYPVVGKERDNVIALYEGRAAVLREAAPYREWRKLLPKRPQCCGAFKSRCVAWTTWKRALKLALLALVVA